MKYHSLNLMLLELMNPISNLEARFASTVSRSDFGLGEIVELQIDLI